MRIQLFITILLFSTATAAQYRCIVGGQKVYSDQPCARNAQHVGALEDKVSADRAAAARRQADANRREAAAIAEAEAMAAEVKERAAAVRRASAPPPVDRCAEARKELARLREPLVMYALAPHRPGNMGREANERLDQIGRAEIRVMEVCAGRRD